MAESEKAADLGVETGGDSRRWDVLAMATFAPLGGFTEVGLTPRLLRADLGIVADVSIPRAPGEFLVAVIRRTSPEGVVPILLTNHKLVWFDRQQSGGGKPTFTGHAAAYNDIGPDVAAETGAGAPVVNIGGGRLVEVPPQEPGLAGALAAALQAISHAARTGEAAPIDAALAQRIVQTIPRAMEMDASLRVQGEDRIQFRSDLFAAVPSAFVSRFVITACVLVFAAMVAKGVNPLDPTTSDLIAWGANDDLRVTVRGEWWRLPASVFLHIGFIHLAFNMWALAALGPLVERLYGNLRFAVLYMAAGVGGAAASLALPPYGGTSAGASGAIFGVVGALPAFLIVRRHAVPPSILRPLKSQALVFIVFNLTLGATLARIDQAAHVGGLVVGFLAGLLLAPGWPRRKPTFADTMRSAALSAVVAVMVVEATDWAIHSRALTIGPAEQFLEYDLQVEPISEKLYKLTAINQEIANLLKDQVNRDQSDRRLDELLARLDREGRENLKAVERIWTPDPKLAKAVGLLAAAQSEQIASVEAVQSFRRTNDLAWIQGDGGFLKRAVELKRLVEARQRLEDAYIRENGLSIKKSEEVPGDGTGSLDPAPPASLESTPVPRRPPTEPSPPD
ncbi:rhomboid family intramembrane serine protease [Paludisphaera rhizosphaerae]|uniref:rhomboid family intramembrane serine protease n=1 Tax=Paludisphaera rhizosphaerae TaxID=2711216 RepID=UPI0013EC87E5|nr:rhomboid family intramembrane serine protease [Paludisphaera rhizosphaerae]